MSVDHIVRRTPLLRGDWKAGFWLMNIFSSLRFLVKVLTFTCHKNIRLISSNTNLQLLSFNRSLRLSSLLNFFRLNFYLLPLTHGWFSNIYVVLSILHFVNCVIEHFQQLLVDLNELSSFFLFLFKCLLLLLKLMLEILHIC